MENRNATTFAHQTEFSQYQSTYRENELVQQRLNKLLALNTQTARQKAMFRSDQEQIEAEMMKRPLSIEETYSFFGLMLGFFSPAAMFVRFSVEANVEIWVYGIMLIINLITTVVGYFSGKLIAKMVRSVEKSDWTLMLLVLPFFGIIWGIITGGAGGILIFIFGAIFGAILGAMVGGVALPIFTVFHRLIKKGELIETKHFLPLAFGVTFLICGFILGL